MRYTTKQGDMWDSIAYSQLGDTAYTDMLMSINSKYHDVYIFSAGVDLDLPDMSTIASSDSLPPWRQVQG